MKSKKALIIVLVVLAVAIVAVLGFNMKPAENAKHDYFLVGQGDKVLVMDALNPVEVVAEFDSQEISDASISGDHSALIITENAIDSLDYITFNLYHFDIASGKKVLIDKNVTNYVVSSDFSIFLYAKENDPRLYRKVLTDAEPTAIAEEARTFYMSDNAETIVYCDSDGNAYFLKNGDTVPFLFGKNVNIKHFERTTGEFVYTDGNELIIDMGDEKFFVSENCYSGDSPGFIGSPNTFYFFETQEELDIFSVFEDDLKETLNLSDKEISDFYDLLHTEFDDRNFVLRKAFYYDHGKITKICDNVLDTVNSSSRSPADNVAAVFQCYKPETKIKLSDIYSVNNLELSTNFFDFAFPEIYSYYIIKKDNVTTELKNKDVISCKYDYNNNEMYLYVDDLDTEEDGLGCIYKASLNSDSDDLTLIEGEKDLLLSSAAVVDDGLMYSYYTTGEKYNFCKNGEVLVSDAEEIIEESSNVFLITVNEDNEEKYVLYSDGKVKSYPDIDFANSYVYTTLNDNILVGDNGRKFYYILNGETTQRIEAQFNYIACIDESPDYGFNYAANN